METFTKDRDVPKIVSADSAKKITKIPNELVAYTGHVRNTSMLANSLTFYRIVQ